ncbi:unnamed protein product [Clonostachys rosea]|uniref:Enoyl reductase (ER) domain-containing protein n=1 Tax=Bionectria ochroleuca TaxID=29856 RepID=A0ABY6TZ07_BIOOC|nr:unnamed protein product [Clonostachys rosea]
MSFTPPKTNRGLYVDANCNFSIRDTSSPLQVGDNELVIENLYSGVNPADTKHATILGIRATTLGYDFCGRVLSSPPGSRFKQGDVVAGLTPSGLGRAEKYGTHQDYLVCPEDMVFKVPGNLPEAHAASLPVVALVAADTIFNFFNFPLPGSNDSYVHQRPVLIWGASSSAGLCAVQFARASGCQNILVTASPARHDMLKKIGATHVFDYRSPTVVDDILLTVEALDQGPIGHAFDAVCAVEPTPSAVMVSQCVKDEAAILVGIVILKDERFKLPFSLAKDDWRIHVKGHAEPITIPARPDDYWRSWSALQWAVDNYGKSFELPHVEVLEGSAEDVLREVIQVGNLSRGFGKIVARHPLK